MSRSMWVDLQLLRSRGAAFEEIGNDVQQVMQRLDDALSAEGRWWGDDEAGAAFEKSYQPDAQQAIASLRDMAQALGGFGRQVREAAGALDAADQVAAESVADTTVATDHVPRLSDDRVVSRADQKSAAGSPSLTTPDSGSPPSTRAVGARTQPQLHESMRGDEHVRPSGSDPSVGTAMRPQSHAPDVAAGARGGIGGAEGVSGPAAEHARGSAPGLPNPDRPVRPEVLAAGQPGRDPLPRPFVQPGRAGTQAPAVSARGDRKPALTPWAGNGTPAGRPSPVAGPARARAAKPTPDKKPATARPQRRGERPSVVAGPAVRPETGNAITRLAQALADRHGVEVSGFETPGLDAAVVGEFLAATDDVLTKHRVIDVGCIAIGAVAERGVVCVSRSRAADADASVYSWSVTLDGELAADPGRLEEILRSWRRPGSAVAQADTRTVYAATAREFGRAFDLAGAGRARSRAQRVLIGEYLRGNGGYRSVGLARVVAGYKRWRDQLSGASFDKGRFDAGAALADAFTDVMLNGEKATEPAKTLCGLLTDAAQVSAARGVREQ
ncbi:hypothetical protein ACQP2U_23270 [Nocardia sp. CA-084685]|uniref:WXG100 family type VII secretion target n=1 Tax=Nocardia sp. CA-084685 TaxID=3239970 RepID=UPI003D9987EA